MNEFEKKMIILMEQQNYMLHELTAEIQAIVTAQDRFNEAKYARHFNVLSGQLDNIAAVTTKEFEGK